MPKSFKPQFYFSPSENNKTDEDLNVFILTKT